MAPLHLIGLLIFAYVAVRLLWALRIRPGYKLLLALPLFVFSQYHFLVRYFFGTLASPEMPYPALIVTGWGFIVTASLFVVLLVRDAFLLCRFLARKAGLGKPVPFSPERRAFATVGLGAALGSYGFKAAIDAPNVATTEIVLNRLPRELDGLVIAHITDLHATAMLHGGRVAAVVDAVNAMRPDCIFCTGDMIDGTPLKRAEDVAPLARLRARYAICGCEGNHEYYSGHTGWMREFKRLGIPMLHNEHRVFDINGSKLVVAGLNDPVAPGFGRPGPDTAKALEGAPADAPVILLSHQPRFARANAAYPVDLQLSGHTHGGQVWGFDQLVASRNDGFLRGLYTVGNMQLYVCSGAGLWTGFPVRLGVPSEIARLVLRCGTR